MDGQSLDIAKTHLEKLKELFPILFSEERLDWGKLRATFGDDINFSNERYTLNWAGKSDAFKTLQVSTTATLQPDLEQSLDFDEAGNVFIEGENLEVLKVLQKSYHGKVKVICIDPPYNTGGDSFVYPDKFSEKKDDYLKRTGQKDAQGFLTSDGPLKRNSKDSGHFHSNWLSMMYPRLFLARNLLSEEGSIFVHIDDNEVHNLRLLMNEVFGEENFVANVIWEKNFSPKNDAKWLSENHDYILIYAKNKQIWRPVLLPRTDAANARYSNPDNDPRGDWTSGDISVKTYSKEYDYPIETPSGKMVLPPKGGCWRFSKEKFQELREDNRIWFGEHGSNTPRVKRFLSEVKDGITPMTIWERTDVGDNQEARKEIKEIFGDTSYFDTPKPVRLLKRIIELSTNKFSNDIVLDFFGGSGTTAHAVLEKNNEDGGNRKFMIVQMPEKLDTESSAYKAGFETIADVSRERILRVIRNKQKSNSELFNHGDNVLGLEGLRSFKLTPSNFRIWQSDNVDAENLLAQMSLFTNTTREESSEQNMLYELMLKDGCRLTDPVAADKDIYIVNQNIVFALKVIDDDTVSQIINRKPRKVIALDKLFFGNDQLKTNVSLQFRDAHIDFKTI